MIKTGTHKLIDVLDWECHSKGGDCGFFKKSLEKFTDIKVSAEARTIRLERWIYLGRHILSSTDGTCATFSHCISRAVEKIQERRTHKDQGVRNPDDKKSSLKLNMPASQSANPRATRRPCSSPCEGEERYRRTS